MSTKRSLPEEDLTCPVCCDIFDDPVIQLCSHTICKGCLHRYWDTKKSRECPVCRRRSGHGELPRNLALKNVCDAFRRVGSSEKTKALCSLHGETFKLFCLDDKEPVCVVCQTSRTHRNHEFCPIDEVAVDYKEEINTALAPLEERLTLLQGAKKVYDRTAEAIKGQAKVMASHMTREFVRLHNYLYDEEARRVKALRDEEKNKVDAIGKVIQELTTEIKTLSDTISGIKEEMQLDDSEFVLNFKNRNFKNTVEKTKCSSKVPEMEAGALMDIANHIGNLSFNIWKNMGDIIQYAPVILNPNTADQHLVMNKDLTTVKYSDDANSMPDNPERFDFYHGVLGSEGFDSGVHQWDVEVGNNSLWYLGIITESTCHKGKAIWNGIWSLWYAFGEYKIQSPQVAPTPLPVSQAVHKVRVKLDYDVGQVSFHDPTDNTCLCSMDHTFTEKVFPFFYNFCVQDPLKIITEKPSVLVGQRV